MSDQGPGADELSPVELRAWRGLIEVTPRLRLRLDRLLMEDSGLSGSDYPVLVALHEHTDPPIRSTELAGRIGWEQSRLSHHLRRMEQRGLIIRRRHANDSRGAEVILTDRGRAAFLAATRGHSRAVKEYFADVLSNPQLEALSGIMDAIQARLDADHGSSQPSLRAGGEH